MTKNQKQVEYVRDPKLALKSAISTLEQFAKKNEVESIAQVSDFFVKDGQLVTNETSSLKKTVGLIRDFIVSLVSKKGREDLRQQKIQVQNAVLGAIETVKRHHLLIAKLNEGNTEDRQLAASTLATIKRYNAVLNEADGPNVNWSDRLARFLYKHIGVSVDEELQQQRIELPVETLYSGVLSVDHLIAPLATAENDPVFKQEVDAIRMKAATLLKNHFKSAAEAIASVRSAPIQATVDTHSQTATLSLTLDVLPGATIKVRGSFKRDSQAHSHSIPISESFKLSFKSMPKGFPYPSQHIGWALDDVLIPVYPHRLDQLPFFQPIYEGKKELALALLPNGKYVKVAKQLLTLRKAVFQAHQEEWLKMLCQLAQAIFRAAPEEWIGQQDSEIIEQFFQSIAIEQDPIQTIIETYTLINELFLRRPFVILQDCWLERKELALYSADPSEISIAAVKILTQERERVQRELLHQYTNKHSWSEQSFKFISLFGGLIGRASQGIIMQHMSETLQCAPAMLTDFEQKIQSIAVLQLLAFNEEIKSSSEEGEPKSVDEMHFHMKRLWETTLAILSSESLDASDHPSVAIAHELEFYFNSRYYRLSGSR